MWSCVVCNPHRICLGDQIKGDEISGACVYVSCEVNGCRVWWGDRNEKNRLEDLGLYGRI